MVMFYCAKAYAPERELPVKNRLRTALAREEQIYSGAVRRFYFR
jgi:hypothetical protein